LSILAPLTVAVLLQSQTAAAAVGSWTVVSSPNAHADGYNVLTGVGVVSPTDAWAVGLSRVRSSASKPFRPLIEHWDGVAWHIAVSAALPAADDARLQAVTVISPTDVWAVGQHTAGTAQHSLIEHWDGVSWKLVAPPAAEPLGATLLGIAAGGSANVWAVGRLDNADGTESTLAEHWNGTHWLVTPTPAVSGLNRNALFSVAVLKNIAWAVGQLGSEHPGPVIERWDGAAWTISASPPTPFYGNLEGISAVSSSDIWAVGFQGVTQTLTEHWNGARWSVVASPSPAGGNSVLSGVAAVSANDAWAIGLVITGGAQKTTLAEHWDGHAWSITATPSPGPLATELVGLAGSAGGPLWAVGSRQSHNATSTLVLRTTA
jgi:hypothetical protein